MDCDTTGIEPDYSLIKFKKLAGGGYFQIVNQSVEVALKELKYNDDQIKEIVEFISKNYTIEGAPHVNIEHYPIFDCANKCGKGNRFIDYNAHLNIMAAATPFLSGSVSKTVNMPNFATIKDVEDVYMKAWKLGIKAIALYRDGSKLSQPLMSVEEKRTIISPVEELQKVEDDFLMESIKNVSIRHRLPNKRIGYTQKAKIAGQSLYIRTGEYDDGKLGEIFIDMHREGATVRSLLNCFSIAISLGLQHGVPLEEYTDAFVFSKFEPSGMIIGHDRIKMANSIIDYIFRDLAINYLDRDDLAHDLKKENTTVVKDVVNSQKKTSVKPGTIFHKISDAISKGFTGDICVECQSMTMVRNGTCLKCVTCGSTTGCS
jgi:ribonucleoside-diphosphate reductase alpha chain